MNTKSKGRSLLPMQAHVREKSEPENGGLARGVLYGLAFCAVTALVSLLLAAVIAYASPDPDALIAPLGFGVMVLSCLAGGLGVGLGCRSGVLVSALLSGCAFVGLSLLLGVFFGGELRQSLTLGLGLGASLGIRAGLVVLYCAAALLTSLIPRQKQTRPHKRTR